MFVYSDQLQDGHGMVLPCPTQGAQCALALRAKLQRKTCGVQKVEGNVEVQTVEGSAEVQTAEGSVEVWKVEVRVEMEA